MRTMSNHIGIARRVASRRAVGSDLDAMNLLIRRLRVVDYSLPPREENARVGRVANEARGKTRENCAEIFVLRAKTYIVRAVLEWTRSTPLSRGGLSTWIFETARALFPPHTTATFFFPSG